MPQRGERSDLTARMQFRVTEVTRERAELAAAELEMPFADWCRAIFEAAVEAHFDEREMTSIEVPSHTTPGATYTLTVDQDRRVVACTCPGWERLGRCRHAESYTAYGPEGHDPEVDESIEDFDARVAAARTEPGIEPEAAATVRAPAVTHPGLHEPEPEPERPSPRDCPHLPQWRQGPTCGHCGGRVAGTGGRIPLRTGLRR